MSKVPVLAIMLVLCFAEASGQGNLDPLTGLPVIPAAETMVAGQSYGFQPDAMPPTMVCKSKMKGEFFSILNRNVKDSKIKLSMAAAWYATHLSGFKKTEGSKSNSPQMVFSNSDGTILVIITGEPGTQGKDGGTYSVSYQKYQPGLSAKTIESFTQSKIVCD